MKGPITGILCLMLVFPLVVFAQLSDRLPEQFTLFESNLSQINPSWNSYLANRLKADVGNKAYVGPFSNVNTLYASFLYRFPRADSTGMARRANSLGIYFSNDREGDLIGWSRGYLQYAFQLKIAREWYMSAGIKAGFINFSVGATSVNAGVSATTMDADIGMSLQNLRWIFALAIVQLPGSSISPYASNIRFARCYQGWLKRVFTISYSLDYAPSIRIRHSEMLGMEYSIFNTLHIQNTFSFGAAFHRRRGLSFLASFDKVPLFKETLSLGFAYNSPLANGLQSNISTFEISLCFLWK